MIEDKTDDSINLYKRANLYNSVVLILFTAVYVVGIIKIFQSPASGVALSVLWIVVYPIIASSLVRKMRVSRAIKVIQNKFRDNPDDIACICSLAAMYAKLNRWKEALPYFLRWVEKKPRDKKGYYGVIQALVCIKDDITAEEWCMNALKVNGDDPVIYLSLGSIYYRMKRNAIAKDNFEKAKKLYEDNNEYKKAQGIAKLLKIIVAFERD